jgi:hypothetical protein
MSEATEETLDDVLQQVKEMNDSLHTIAGIVVKFGAGLQGGKGGGRNTRDTDAANESMRRLTDSMSRFIPAMERTEQSLTVVGVAANLVATAFEKIGGVIGSLFMSIGKVSGIMLDFAKTAASGNMKVSELIGVMGNLVGVFTDNIPILGSLFRGLFDAATYLIQRQEQMLDVFRKMASIGADLGDSFSNIRTMMNSTGLTFDEFTGIIQRNSDVFATLGSDVNKGKDMFVKTMQETMGKDSEVGRALFGLGYTAQQAGELTASYMRSQGTMNKQGLQDASANSAAVLELATNMTGLAEATGKQRDQLQKQLDDATAETNWKNFVASLNPEQVKVANEKLTYALAHGGTEVGNQLKTYLMTGIVTPMNETQIRNAALTNGATTNFVKSIGDASGTFEQRSKQMNNANYDLAVGTKQAADQVGTVSGLLQAQGKQSLLDGDLIANKNRVLDNGEIMSREKYIKQTEEQNKQAAKGNADAKRLADDQQNIRRFGEAFDNIITTLAGPFLSPIMTAVESFTGTAMGFVTMLKPYIDQFSSWMEIVIKRFSDIKNIDDFWKKVKQTFTEIWAWVKPTMLKIWEDIKPPLIAAVKSLFQILVDTVIETLPRWMTGFAKTSTEKKDQTEKDKAVYMADLKKQEDTVNQLKKEKADYEKSNPGKKWEHSFSGLLHSGELSHGEKNINSLQKKIKDIDASLGETEPKQPATPANHLTPPAKPPGPNAPHPLTNHPAPPAKPPESNAPHPPVDNSAVAKDWAFKIMSGVIGRDKVPSSLKDSVDALIKNPDSSLKRAVDGYKAEMQRKAVEKAEQEKPKSQPKVDTPAALEKDSEEDITPLTSPQESKIDTVLNNTLLKLVSLSSETVQHTKKTASLIAANGNLFQS